MTLTRYGLREWLTITVVAVAAAAALGVFVTWWLALPVAAVWLAIASFFRDPSRTVPENLPAGVMLSPADGTVSAVETVDEHEATAGPATIIRIFLSVLNVHVNRAPCDGEVVAIAHRPGRYLDARSAESAQANEANLVTLRLEGGGGETVGVRQVAGKIARRIVCRLRPGDRVARGQRFGMIKFGSTAELILPRPEAVRVHVGVGEKVRGGLTQLATLHPRSAAAEPPPGAEAGRSAPVVAAAPTGGAP